MSSVRLFCIAVLALCSAEFLFAQGGHNVQHLGQLRTRGTSGYSNCWGYNGPNGKEYALVGCFGGTQIVDITGDTLKEVAFIPGPNSGWREMKVYQKYAYVVTEGTGAGIQIIDLDSLKLVNTINIPQVMTGHTVSIEGKYLYVNGSNYKVGGIVAFDLTDPKNPVVVGEYQAQYVHDCVIKNDTIYAAAVYGQGIDVIDATDKANMKRVSITNYPFSGTHNTDLTADKRYIFSTDEVNSSPDQMGNILRVWDRSDIKNLKLVGTYLATPKTIVHNIHVKGNYGYLSHYSEGLRILDLRFPEIPVEVAHYDTYVGSSFNYVGAWGTFPYFNSEKVIISDMSGGLHVIKFTGQNGSVRGARAIITVRDSVTNLPLANVKVAVAGKADTLLTDAQGKIKIGSLKDTLQMTFILSSYSGGYKTKSETVVLSFDSIGQKSVALSPNPTGSATVTVTNKTNGKALKNIGILMLQSHVIGVTDSAGKFSVSPLMAGGKFWFVASRWGYVTETLSVTIAPSVVTNLAFQLTPNGLDDFETNKGWTVGSPSDSGTAGRWVRAVPTQVTLIGDIVQPGSDHTANGTLCFVTGSSNGTADNVEGRATLTSPSFDPSDMTNPTILFWVFTNTRANPIDDTLTIQLSNTNGSSWVTVKTIVGKFPQWTQHRLVIKDYLTPSAEMKIRFVARDGGNPSLYDVAIDDVEFGDNLQLSVGRRDGEMPAAFVLHQNYPNPFNPSTTITYEIPSEGPVRLTVYDLLGKEVAVVVNTEQSAGRYTVGFNGESLSSGVYFYTLQSGSFTETKKLVLMK